MYFDFNNIKKNTSLILSTLPSLVTGKPCPRNTTLSSSHSTLMANLNSVWSPLFTK